MNYALDIAIYIIFSSDWGSKFLQQTTTRFAALMLQKKRKKTLRERMHRQAPTQKTNVYTYAPLAWNWFPNISSN